MNQLIEGLQKPDAGASKADHDKYENSLARYILVKEEHAELVKREVRVIWGDYFRPEHAQQNPEIHNVTWNIMKLASQGRQQVNMQVAQDLLAEVHKFAEFFWQTKNVEVKRQPSNQTVGGEIVVPAN
jgi:nickel superoxide dismutase